MSKEEVNLYDLSRQDFETIESTLAEKPDLKLKKDGNDRMLIHWASLHGCERLVELLLADSSVPFDAIDDTQATPLILATLGGHLHCVQLLAEKGADINHKNHQGHSALQYACSKEKKDIVQYLLERGADINITDGIKDTPLHRLAMKGQNDILKVLLENKIKPKLDLQNSQGNTALHIACEDDETVFALALIDAGASIEILNKEKHSPLDVCKPGLRRQIKTKLNIED